MSTAQQAAETGEIEGREGEPEYLKESPTSLPY